MWADSQPMEKKATQAYAIGGAIVKANPCMLEES